MIIGIPAYNEAGVLPKLLDSIMLLREKMGNCLGVLVVNDGSTDSTEVILREYVRQNPWVTFISHGENRGLGEAIKTVFYNAVLKYSENDVLVTLDGDNTHRPDIIPEMVRKLKEEGLDLVIASRFTRGGKEIGLSIMRKIYSRAAGVILKAFFPIPHVRDYSCGFRAYELGYLKRAMKMYNGEIVTSGGFECMAEILARFSKIGVKVREYPLELHYELKEGRSKMCIARTIRGYLRLLRTVKKPLPLAERLVK